MHWLIYGANGYTGRLMVAEAAARGLRPVLAGRSASVKALAESQGLEARIFELDQPAAVRDGLSGIGLVMHCAGPFSATSAPMLQGCLDVGAHYLDITGEIPVFEAAWNRREEARKSDIVVCPGTGFDVVPTDCLAASLVQRLPAATRLLLAFEAGGGASPGTAKTATESLGRGMVRKDGRLTSVPPAWKTREVDFAHARRSVVTIPWGDVFTAWVSTGVPDIEVYLSMPPAQAKRLRRSRWLAPLLSSAWVQRRLKSKIEARVTGPDEQRRSATGFEIWGEVQSADGRRVSGTMSGPNGYELTVTASLGIVESLLQGANEGGYYTPSLLMGPDYAASLPGVTMDIAA